MATELEHYRNTDAEFVRLEVERDEAFRQWQSYPTDGTLAAWRAAKRAVEEAIERKREESKR